MLLPRSGATDLPEIRAIGEDEEPLFEAALLRRIELGDESAVPTFIEKIRANETGFWWQATRKWWCPAFTAELDQELNRRRQRKAQG